MKTEVKEYSIQVGPKSFFNVTTDNYFNLTKDDFFINPDTNIGVLEYVLFNKKKSIHFSFGEWKDISVCLL